MLKRQFYRHLSEELVEDSEPEREESRKRRKEKRRERSERKRRNALEVIELTDSDSQGLAVTDPDSSVRSVAGPKSGSKDTKSRRRSHSPMAHLDSSDFSDIDFVKAFTGRSQTNASKADALTGLTTCREEARSQTLQNRIPTDVEDQESDSELEERTKHMRRKLGRYALSAGYQASLIPDHSYTASTVTVDATRVAESRTEAITQTRKHTRSTTTYLDFSERELKSILKCVSCDLTWTTRKTIGHKVAHMRTCAKRTRLTGETMKILISHAINPGVPHATKPQMTINDQADDQPPKSVLMRVVEGGEARQSRRLQKEVPSSLRSVVESRTDIIERAQLFIRPSSSRQYRDTHPPMIGLAFGKSHLGASSSLVPPDFDEDAVVEPSRTQAFPDSNLAGSLTNARSGAGIVTPTGLITDPHSPDDPPATHIPDIPKLVSTIRTDSLVQGNDMTVDTVSPYSASSLGHSHDYLENDYNFRGLEDNLGYNIDNANDFDDAILTYEPEAKDSDILANKHIRIGGVSDREVRLTFHGEGGNAKMGTKGSHRDNNESTHVHENWTAETITKKTARARSMRKRISKQTCGENVEKEKEKETISDEDLFEKLKVMVLEDERLYMRVLRYEPIHFNAFLEGAQKLDKNNELGILALRIKLRTFLDKQAIHYYGITWNR